MVTSKAGRVGILGGTFDPVHNAHLAIARAALEQLGLDRILFIPTGPTRYRTPAATSAQDRLAMLRLALQGEPRFEIDARELAPGATGYTVDTLRALKLDSPTLLMGADQYQKLDAWHRPDEVRRLAKLAVVGRPGIDLAAGVKTLRMPPMDVSSSDIRVRAARGEDISGLVPAAVANYIAEKGLYRQMDIRRKQRVVVDALEDVKARDIVVFNTARMPSMFERVVIASGESNRQLRALADRVKQRVKEDGGTVYGVEGEAGGEWVLVDLGDLVVHIMHPTLRGFYNLEEVWGGKKVAVGAKKAAAKCKKARKKPAPKAARGKAARPRRKR